MSIGRHQSSFYWLVINSENDTAKDTLTHRHTHTHGQSGPLDRRFDVNFSRTTFRLSISFLSCISQFRSILRQLMLVAAQLATDAQTALRAK